MSKNRTYQIVIEFLRTTKEKIHKRNLRALTTTNTTNTTIFVVEVAGNCEILSTKKKVYFGQITILNM